MPFGLKNARATYQRLVNKMFQKQIGASMVVYIDDMLVKSTTAELHIAYLSDVSNSALGLLYGHGILTIYKNLLL